MERMERRSATSLKKSQEKEDSFSSADSSEEYSSSEIDYEDDQEQTIEELKNLNNYVIQEWQDVLKQLETVMDSYHKARDERDGLKKKLEMAVQQMGEMKQELFSMAEEQQKTTRELIQEKEAHAETIQMLKTQSINKILSCRCDIIIKNGQVEAISIVKDDEMQKKLKEIEQTNTILQQKLERTKEFQQNLSDSFIGNNSSYDEMKELVNSFEDILRYESKNEKICFNDLYEDESLAKKIGDGIEQRFGINFNTVFPIVKQFRLNKKKCGRSTIVMDQNIDGEQKEKDDVDDTWKRISSFSKTLQKSEARLGRKISSLHKMSSVGHL